MTPICRFNLHLYLLSLISTGPSLKTKIWVVLIKLLTTAEPSLYSYQASLPRLPLPGLDATIERYLRSVRPLSQDEEHYRELEKKALEFKNGIGRKLQRYLWLKSWWATNYVGTLICV